MNNSANGSGRVIIVGDIHGCRAEFEKLLDKLNFIQGSDRLILAGDLVDRGPDSAGVVKLARALGAEAVSGNHEGKLLRRWKHIKEAKNNPSYRIPVKPSKDQEKTIRELSYNDLDWLSQLPYYIELPELNTLVVHAGVAPGIPIHRQSREVLTMVRYIDNVRMTMVPLQVPGFKQPPNSFYWAEAYDGHRNVIFGHTVVGKEVRHWQGVNGSVSCWGIDTGCVFGGCLTACVFDLEGDHRPRFVSVDALDDYSGLYT
jgi:hypothetical protein